MFRLTLVLCVLLAGAAAVIGFMVARPGGIGSGITTTKQETSIHATVREVLPAAEFVSLHYRYTSVIKDINSREMFGIQIPGTEKKLLAVIDGTIKLGIDCQKIQIDTTRTDTLFIKFPPIKIISHELHPETAEVYDQKNGMFNRYKARDLFVLESKQKSEIEFNIDKNHELISQARTATEYAFKSFLHSVHVLDTIPIAFRWN
ncbi:MAG: DUF4230 domain-containing protein [Fibromonadaceae bacterium]|jgi:hypothetical protein|nr:DUF4230 domain-containing protein [Fibromonadaceae bacterium]